MRNFIFLSLLSCTSVVINQPPGHVVASENHVYNGKRQLEKGHCRQAIEQFNKAIEKDPTNFQAYYWRGVAYGMCSDCNNAIRNLEISIKYKPSNVWDSRIKTTIGLCQDIGKGKGKGKNKGPDFSITFQWLWE